MSNQKSFIDAVKDRRTIYQLNKEAPISDKQISEIAEKAILHVPSSFNNQSTRLVVLLNKEHETFWQQVAEVLKAIVPEDQFPQTEQKLKGFEGAYGTVSVTPLFFLLGSLLYMTARACVVELWKLEASNCPTMPPFHQTPLPERQLYPINNKQLTRL